MTAPAKPLVLDPPAIASLKVRLHQLSGGDTLKPEDVRGLLKALDGHEELRRQVATKGDG